MTPLKTEFYRQFEAGTKTTEFRREGPRWNALTCFVGRPVVLSHGYTRERLAGEIVGFHLRTDAERIPGWATCYGPGPAVVAAIHIKLSAKP